MNVRRHTPSDHLAIAELRWLLKTGDGSDAGGYDREEFIENYLLHLSEMDRRGGTTHWLLDDGGKITGVITVRLVGKEPSPGESAGSWGYVTNTFVSSSRRNKGFGTQLLNAVISWAYDEGLELLIVWPSERSYPFYRRAGFTGGDDPLQLVLHDCE